MLAATGAGGLLATSVAGALAVAPVAGAAQKPFQAQSAKAIMSQVNSAVARTGSVTGTFHVTQKLPDGAGTITVDVAMYWGHDAGSQQWTASSTDSSLPSSILPTGTVLRVGSALYLKGSAGFWDSQGNVTTAEEDRLANVWVQVPSGTSLYKSVGSDMTWEELNSDNFNGQDHFSKGPVTTFGGVQVVTIKMHGADQGTIYVQVAGSHLPLALVMPKAGTVTFSGWGQAQTITAPQGAVPLASLAPALAKPSGKAGKSVKA